MTIGLFRKKPVVIEAVQWMGTPESAEEIAQFMGHTEKNPLMHYPKTEPWQGDLVIPTLEGAMVANTGDWIIKGVQGEFYPCKPDIFEATYEQIGEIIDDEANKTIERLFPEGSQVDG